MTQQHWRQKRLESLLVSVRLGLVDPSMQLSAAQLVRSATDRLANARPKYPTRLDAPRAGDVAGVLRVS